MADCQAAVKTRASSALSDGCQRSFLPAPNQSMTANQASGRRNAIAHLKLRTSLMQPGEQRVPKQPNADRDAQGEQSVTQDLCFRAAKVRNESGDERAQRNPEKITVNLDERCQPRQQARDMDLFISERDISQDAVDRSQQNENGEDSPEQNELEARILRHLRPATRASRLARTPLSSGSSSTTRLYWTIASPILSSFSASRANAR
jgi:hypothetical protein